MRFSLIALIMLGLLGCKPSPKQDQAPPVPPVSVSKEDPHSYAQAFVATVTHADLDLKVDFDNQKIIGKVTLDVTKQADAQEIILDTKQLTIKAVQRLDAKGVSTAVPVQLGPEDEHKGAALIIPIDEYTGQVVVEYETQPGAEALQFLSPDLTADKKHPFLLTQSQSIFARTWVPIQDSPGIRFTYSAKVSVPPGLMAVMSAENPTEKNETGVYTFKMDQPIPAYLLALAVGDVEFKALGERSGVYAEPSVLEKAAYEFGEVEEMMDIAEDLYGPYQWDRYDIIVLPPSFPFGGMENPRLTFATPTILAGDRSLVSLVAHELAHSWSGNLVTNATWNDFWLNEGFTVYFENRIMEALNGPEYAGMLAQISMEDLRNEVADMGEDSRDTWLFQDLATRHPDDGMTSIAYEKGFYFLKLIEKNVGREAFDAFVSQYFSTYAFQTMNTASFVEILEKELLAAHPEAKDEIDIQAWIYGPGIPETIPFTPSSRFEAAEKAVDDFLKHGVRPQDLPTQDWSSHEWQHFIRSLPEEITEDRMAELDAVFNLTESTNAEVQFMWYLKAVKAEYEPSYPAIRAFLTEVGRRKFLAPLYRAMTENEIKLRMAKDIYQQARANYHPVSQGTIDEILNWGETM
ncbi:MAG: M1 family metallopeptidase [Bacteroidota bacterium]